MKISISAGSACFSQVDENNWFDPVYVYGDYDPFDDEFFREEPIEPIPYDPDDNRTDDGDEDDDNSSTTSPPATNPPAPPPVDPTTTPDNIVDKPGTVDCIGVNNLASDPDFNNIMIELDDLLGEDREYGYYIESNGTVGSRIEGEENAGVLPDYEGYNLQGFVHNHDGTNPDGTNTFDCFSMSEVCYLGAV